MSFLSSIKSIGKTILTKAVAPVMDFGTVAFAHPIQTAKALTGPSTIKEVEEKHFSQPIGTQIKQIALATVGYAATVVGAGAASTAAKAGTLVPSVVNAVKNLVPSTTKGKLIAAAVVPIAASAVIEKPSLALSVPKDVLNFQSDAGKLLANPSLSAAKELVTESPVISSLVAAGGVAAVGLGTASIVSNVVNTQAVKRNTEEMRKEFTIQPYTEGSETQPIQIINQLPPQLPPAPAVVAPSEAAPAGTIPKKKKKAKKKATKKKKTRRSKKKTTKKKKKVIKRRKSKK